MPIELRPGGPEGCDVVGFGLNTVDLLAQIGPFPAPDTKQRLRELVERPGGQVATALVACGRLGWRTRYVGTFGNDRRGGDARDSLERDGVDISDCRVVAAPQPYSLILVDDLGRRTVFWNRAHALNMASDQVKRSAVTRGRVLLVDCDQTAAATQAARYARRAGIPTVIDVEKRRPAIEALLSTIDVLISSRTFPEEFTGVSGVGAALRALAREFRSALVCVTLGSEGSLALVGGKEIRTPGFRVPVVDTTGAGDVFRGGFIAGWLAAVPRAHAEDVLAYANAAAALNCRALGARGAIPTPEEVDELLRRSP